MDPKIQAFVNSIQSYFRGVRTEWGKINWPERKQVITETVFVIIIVTGFTIAVYVMDLIFKSIFDLLK